MGVQAPEGYTTVWIGNGKVTHAVAELQSRTACGKDTKQSRAGGGGKVGCKACVRELSALNTAPAVDAGDAPAEAPAELVAAGVSEGADETPAARNTRVTEEVNTLIEKVRAHISAGEWDQAQACTDEADLLMADLPPAMRGLLRASLMEAKQTEPAALVPQDTDGTPDAVPNVDEVTYATVDGEDVLHFMEVDADITLCKKPWEEEVDPYVMPVKEDALRCAECVRVLGTNDPYAAEWDQIREHWQEQGLADADAAPASDEEETSAAVVPAETKDLDKVPGMVELIAATSKKVFEVAKTKTKGAAEIAESILDMRTRIHDRDGDIDLGARTDAAKKAAASTYQAVLDALPEDDVYGLEGEVNSIKKAVQNAMQDVVCKYVKSLDHSPEEAAKFARATEAHPELSVSEAVYRYYENAEKPLPRLTRAELARKKREEAKLLAAKVKELAQADTPETEEDDAETELTAEVAPEPAPAKTDLEKHLEALEKARTLLSAVVESGAKVEAKERKTLATAYNALVVDLAKLTHTLEAA